MMADQESVPILGTESVNKTIIISNSYSDSSSSDSETTSCLKKSNSSHVNEEAKLGKPSVSKISHRAKGNFLLLGVISTVACMCFSLFAPFYPAEARAKGLSPTMRGMVFSCYELAVFVSAPVFGKLVAYIGARKTFIGGLFAAGTSTALFGLSYLTPAVAPFLIQCLVLRLTQGVGCAAFLVAIVPFVAQDFPDYVSTVYGALKIFNGTGYMLGPLVGGALFEAGGFGLPFYVIGGLQLVCFVAAFFLLPPDCPGDKAGEKNAFTTSRSRCLDGPNRRLLSSPLMVLSLFTSMTGAYSITFFESSAAVHFEQFNLSAIQNGGMFVIVASIFAVSSPLFGWLSDSKRITYPFLIQGNFALCAHLLLIAPSPLLTFLRPSFGLTVFSIVLLGIGLASTVVPVLSCFYVAARRVGFEDGLRLNGLLSGFLNSSYHFGAFVGPLLGNAVIEVYGYGWSTTVNAAICLINGVSVVVYIILERTCCKYSEKNDDASNEIIVTGNTSEKDCNKRGTINYAAVSQRDDVDSQNYNSVDRGNTDG